MKLLIGGVRGTCPVAQPEFMRYGGETTSFLVESAGDTRVLVDAGTGVRRLGLRLAGRPGSPSVLMLITHYHLDHIVGLPSLGLIYRPEWTIEMAAPAHGSLRIDEIMPRIIAKPFWPLQMEDLESRIHFSELAPGSRELLRGDLAIRWCTVPHPGGCTAYRIDEPATGRGIVIATDVEWSAASAGEKQRFLSLCRDPRPPTLLLFDGQYTPEELDEHRGWGHSSWMEAADVAREAGAGSLLVIHHDPSRNDEALGKIERQLEERLPHARFARGGEEIDV
jgi:phosphoribosyl 1,2-cyclic phosphodiesterase